MTRLGDTIRLSDEGGKAKRVNRGMGGWTLVATLLAICLVLSATGAQADPPAPSAPLADQDDDEKNDEKKGAEDKDEDDEGDGKNKSKTKAFGSPSEKYVKEKLEGFLSPSSIKWLEDGRCEMTFKLGQKDGSHESIFSRPIGARVQDRFRWTTRDEEFVVGGVPGIRVSDSGAVLLRAWYTDNVEAEVEYRQYINLSRRHVLAVIFQNEKGSALGSNFGNQCAMFSKGRLRKKTKEKIKSVVFNATAKFGLKVKDGVFEAHRDNYLSSKRKYTQKTFPRGQVGFIWGGSLAGVVGSLKITGKIDYEFMEKELKKRRRRGRRR